MGVCTDLSYMELGWGYFSFFFFLRDLPYIVFVTLYVQLRISTTPMRLHSEVYGYLRALLVSGLLDKNEALLEPTPICARRCRLTCGRASSSPAPCTRTRNP
jgi:hypothetical protein